jgi:SM-20-related protein
MTRPSTDKTKLLGRLPPVVRLQSFLGEISTGHLLDYAIAHEEDFMPSDLQRKGEFFVDPSIRVSKKLLELGNLKDLIQMAVDRVLGSVLQQLGIGDLGSHFYELELVWHGDGAFFKRHSDTIVHGDKPLSRRILSMVYYFHKKPKAFAGGHLRLYALGSEIETGLHREIEPDSDSAVFFPSWFPHEVLPVQCGSKAFADGRFAVNCWVHKTLTGS